MNEVTFKQIKKEIARQLVNFSEKAKIGDTIKIDGKTYTFNYQARSSSAFFKSRGLSLYFRVNRSVVRISDHWAKTNHHPRSKKFNCVSVSGKYWNLNDSNSDTISTSAFRAGKYPFELKAGIAGLSKINKDCEHWA